MKYKSEVDVGVLCLFFNRPEYFRQVFEQVRKARPSKLFLYQDGPREGRDDMPGILECRKIAENIDWECENDHDKPWMPQNCTLRERIHYLYSPKGLAYKEYLYYVHTFFPSEYLSSIIKLWLKTIFPVLWEKLKK